jgi:hypothetical protein
MLGTVGMIRTGRRLGELVLGRGVRLGKEVRLPVVGPWDSTC